MALKFAKMFGGDKAKTLDGEDLDMPTTQVKMAQTVQAGYDPLASVSIMEQLRSASANMATPRKLWFIGNLPVVKQFQTLGVLMVTFLLFAALMVYLDSRQSSQGAAASATATEMQMLSQRLARGSTNAAQGQASAFRTVSRSRSVSSGFSRKSNAPLRVASTASRIVACPEIITTGVRSSFWRIGMGCVNSPRPKRCAPSRMSISGRSRRLT